MAISKVILNGTTLMDAEDLTEVHLEDLNGVEVFVGDWLNDPSSITVGAIDKYARLLST